MGVFIRRAVNQDLDRGFTDVLSQLSPGVGKPPGLFDGEIWFVAVDAAAGRVVGLAKVFVERKLSHVIDTGVCGLFGQVGHIEDVVVDKEYRGKGIGGRLIEHCLNFCRERRCYKAILGCKEDVAEFYERCGFHQSGVEMRLDLE